MSTSILNPFAAFQLSPREELEGATFNITQLQKLQNRMAQVAEEKLNAAIDPGESDRDFFLRLSYMSGKIDVLKLMMMEHEEAVKYLTTSNGIVG